MGSTNCPWMSSCDISPNASFNSKLGTGKKAGLCRVCASALANSAWVMG